MTLSAGARVGPYEIVELIGRGGMGEVYSAVDQRLGRKVAIKVLPSEIAGKPESLLRFRREARAIATLSHPNILSVFDVGDVDDVHYVVTELLEGETLRSRLGRGPMTLGEMIPVAMDIAEGLAAAHAKGIIHRDLKPENVFLTEPGVAKILDFGLASTQQPPFADSRGGETRADTLTQPGVILGTIGYLSPEQLRGRPLTTACDVFAFGCVAFEMLRGEMPFQRDSNMEVIASVLLEEPFRRDGAYDMPHSLRALIQRCLEKEPEARFQNGGELLEALRVIEAAHEQGKLASEPIGVTERLPHRGRRRRVAFVAGVLVLFAIAVASLVAQRERVVDNGYDLHAADITGTSETRRLMALALHADADGDRFKAIELCREAARLDPRAPLPPAFLAWFIYFNGDPQQGRLLEAEAKRRIGNASSTYEELLCRYLDPDNDGAAMIALASSMLELRPKAWRLRLSIAHRHLDRRETRAMLAQLQRIDVADPDDRRLAIVLADRASLGDLTGATRDLERSKLKDRPALLAYTRGRIAWSSGRPADAVKYFRDAADRATIENLGVVAAESRVLGGIASLGAGDLDGAQSAFDVSAVKEQRLHVPQWELDAHAFGAYVAYLRGDREGMRQRLEAAVSVAGADTLERTELRLFIVRSGAPVAVPPLPLGPEGDLRDGVPSLIAAREAWARGDRPRAAELLRQARAEGVDATWFAEEAALLAYDLGARPTHFACDPPYPNLLRYIAIWELARGRR